MMRWKMSSSKNLKKKAEQAQVIFDQLVEMYGIHPIPTTFVADASKHPMFAKACVTNVPFPGPFAGALSYVRSDGVSKLFKEEKVLQTPAIAAVLSACSSVATEIGELRGDDVSDAETYCDMAFAGMQAIRLFMSDTTGRKFRKRRFDSAVSVDNAFNGTFHKYTTKDNREFSFHVYYQDQQRKLVEALHMSKPSKKYTFLSVPKDKKEIAEVVSQYDAIELEDKAFDCGACACMLRSRSEWESSDVGQAVIKQPLIDEVKETDGDKPNWGMPNSRGPLSGIKVLDLTHIIAGPACSRILVEYGADVLMVRRGKFIDQEQAMLEFDGWAGKNSIQLDFNDPTQLAKCKELIKEADVVTYSYQNGTLDKFGLSEEDIRALNPNVIYSNLNCFSETVWRTRPGWAPCAEDMTGLSVRNGSMEKPKNLNGVPLDYFPGFILALGTLLAIKHKLEQGGGYKVTTSLTRGAQYLHEVTDLCEGNTVSHTGYSRIVKHVEEPTWDQVLHYVGGCAIGGKAGFPGPGTVNTAYPFNKRNLVFTDGNTTWNQK